MGDFSGGFFTGRPLSAKDLGAFARAAVPDGVLSGCEMSYSGNVLTVASGVMIACGRVFILPSAKRLTLSGATNGYARVLVEIDLSGTSTETEFDQVNFTVNYASSLTNFADLVQEDINVGGTVYQMEACVATLSGGSIATITSTMRTELAATGRMPAGSIYISTNPESPATFYGGKWERIKDRFLLAAGDSYAAGATGGEAAHTLTTDEMPSHRHKLSSESYVYFNSPNGWGSQTSGSSYSYTSSSYTAYNGGGTAHNNMPPYLAVYVWRCIEAASGNQAYVPSAEDAEF